MTIVISAALGDPHLSCLSEAQYLVVLNVRIPMMLDVREQALASLVKKKLYLLNVYTY